jgi:DNA-binding Lrp family transcriptional regulator
LTTDAGSVPGGAGHSAGATLDAIDRRLVQELRADGRIAMVELAARLGISRGNAYFRYDRLRREGVLRGFTALVDPRRLGLPVAAFVSLKVAQDGWRPVSERLLALPEVEHVALTSGEYDFIVLVRAPDVAALRDLVLDRLRGVPGVHSTHTTMILDEWNPAGPPARDPAGNPGAG